ncbi:DUF3291 domain-containing protein, partial [Streptomyces violaceoruber]
TPYAFTLRTTYPAGASEPVPGEVPEGLDCSV